MKTLILIRHAEAAYSEPTQADIDRPLSRRGYRTAQSISKKFARRGVVPDLILSGSAPRALKTAEMFARRLGVPPGSVQINRRIYEAERAEMVGLVRELNDQYETVMLVGHNPGISSLLHHLADSKIHSMPNASVAVITMPIASWREIAFKSGMLEMALCPRNEERQMYQKENKPGLREQVAAWMTQRSRRIELFFTVFISFALLLGVMIFFLSRADGSGRLPGTSRFRHIDRQDPLPFSPDP